MLDDPSINAAVIFTELFPVGLLVTLVSAAVLRKQEAEKTTGPASFILTDPDGNPVSVDQHR